MPATIVVSIVAVPENFLANETARFLPRPNDNLRRVRILDNMSELLSTKQSKSYKPEPANFSIDVYGKVGLVVHLSNS